MQIIWHGTASIEIVCDRGRILFDPFVPLKGSDVDVSIEEFDGFTDIFVTHGHLDHITDLPKVAERNPGVVIHCTATPYRTLQKKGVPARNLSILRFGDVTRVNGFTIRALHGRHAVLPNVTRSMVAGWVRHPARRNVPYMFIQNLVCRENDETVFYQIEADGKTVQLMGSMNLRDNVRYPQGADLLVLPYNGWTDNFPPAVRVIERLRPRRVLLDHYDDTFPPLTTPLDLSPILAEYPGLVTAMQLRKVYQV